MYAAKKGRDDAAGLECTCGLAGEGPEECWAAHMGSRGCGGGSDGSPGFTGWQRVDGCSQGWRAGAVLSSSAQLSLPRGEERGGGGGGGGRARNYSPPHHYSWPWVLGGQGVG